MVFTVYYLTDVYLFKFLHQRLYFSDVTTFFDSATINEVFLRDVGNHTVGMLLVLFGFGFVFFHRKIKLFMLDKIMISSLMVLIIGLWFFVSESNYVNSIGIRNIVEINYRSKASIDYDEKTLKILGEKISDVESLICKSNGLNLKKNVILLVWESLSMYHSKLFSGLNDWTPHLDNLAKNNRYYSNFFANNFTSSHGRIALLTGEKTFKHIDAKLFGKTRVGFWNTQRNLPKLFRSAGYSTSFLDAANLKFTQTGEYMEAIGFDYVEGHNYKGYRNKKRYGFNSVADKVLLNRVVDFVKDQEIPFFSTVITVTTHPPFVNPDTNKPSQEGAIKYVDQAVFDFYQALEKANYFEDGLLVIVSDHRSMTPVSKEETERYGKQAVSRVPMVVIDKSYSGNTNTTEYLQQSDLLNSFDYLINENHCYREGEGNVFSDPAQPSTCVFHTRGDYRDNLDIYCDNSNQSATLKLYGDKTKVIEGSLKNEQSIIEMINTSRIGARNRHKKLFGAQK